jgi:hypothetical protein
MLQKRSGCRLSILVVKKGLESAFCSIVMPLDIALA